MDGCTSYVSEFRGRTIRLPETVSGKAKLTLADFKKIIHDKPLIGADSGAAKLQVIDSTGNLADSVDWHGGWGSPPYTWTLDSGAFPGGVTIDSGTGEISGTPTETGTFAPVIKVTNGVGESVTATMSMIVKAYVNEQFLSADGLGTFTLKNSGSVSIVSDKCRIAFNDTKKWNDDTFNPGDPPFDPVSVYRACGSGNWTIRAKFSMNTTPADCFRVGLCALTSTGITGYYGGILFGFYGNLVAMVAHNLYTGAESHDNGYEYISDPFYSGNWAGTRTAFEFMLRRNGSNVGCYRREVGATTWSYIDGAACSPFAVGIVVSTNQTRNISVDVDYLMYAEGDLGFDRTVMSKARVGVPYSCSAEGKGGAGEYVYAVSAGTLPVGLALNTATGEISGRPEETGTATFTIQVTDGLAATATQEYTITTVYEVSIVPDVLVAGWTTKDYTAQLDVNAIGELDISQVTIYDSCRLGEWAVKFSSSTDFEISGPGVAGVAGDTETDLVIPGVMKIDAAAWGGTIIPGYELTFKTCISWENENPVQALYDVLALKTGLPTNLINASSYFGDKYLGKLAASAAAGATEITVTVTVPTVIETGETLIITEGATTEEVTVATGNDEATGYPPEITLLVSSLANSYTKAATVTWKERGSLDTSGLYSFDDEFSRCVDESIAISLSADREMSIAQIEEVIAAHIDGFLHHDNWGVDRIHTFRPRSGSTVATIDNTIMLSPGAEVETLEVINEIKVKHGYDYAENKYLYEFTYPESDAANKSLWRNEIKRTVEVLLPGFYTATPAVNIATMKFLTREDGLRVFVFNATLKALLMRIGERYTMNSTRARFNSEVEIIGMRSGRFVDDIQLQFAAYDRTQFMDL